MSGPSSRSPASRAGWELIDEALDGIHRAAFAAVDANEFHETLARCLRPVGVLRWSVWQLDNGIWRRSVSDGPEHGDRSDGTHAIGPAAATEPTPVERRLGERVAVERVPAKQMPAKQMPVERIVVERAVSAAAWEANASRMAVDGDARAAADVSPGAPQQRGSSESGSSESGSFASGCFESGSFETRPREHGSSNNGMTGANAPSSLVVIAAPFGKGDVLGGVFVAWREPLETGSATQGFARLTEAIAEEVWVFALRRALRDSRPTDSRPADSRPANSRPADSRPARLDQLLAQLHENLSLTATAHVLVNEARILLACDRVAVSLAAGRRQRLVAMSGTEQPHRQSAVVERLEPLCAAVAAMGEPLWFGGQSTSVAHEAESAPELLAMWEAYREVSPCQSLAILPLGVPSPLGTLVCERIERSLDASVAEVWRKLEPHAATALANARVVSRIPGHRFWLRWAKAGGGMAGQRGAALVAALAVVVASLGLVPAELKVQAAGELRSVARREVFAPADGVVEALHVEHGQLVAADAVLLVVHSPELDRQWQEARGVADSLQRQLASVQSQRLQARAGDSATRQRAAALAAEEEQLQTQRKSQAERVALLEGRRRSLQVRSPIAGRIVSWGLRDRLSGRPLRRGDPLLTVAGDGGPFELELRVPERVAGRVLAAADGATGGHDVAWTLASRPEATRRGKVCELARRFDYDEWGGGFLRVRVALEDGAALETAPREVGEMVAAKIACGRVSLAESWFFELIDTARRWWWL